MAENTSEGSASLKAPLQDLRLVKDLVKEYDVWTSRKSIELSEILSRSSEVAEAMKGENSEWVKKREDEFKTYLAKIPRRKIEDAFNNGLESSIRSHYSLFRDQSPASVEDLKREDYLKDLITAYSADFVLMLRMAKRFNIEPSRALRLARYSYINNPQTLKQLIEEFPEFEIWGATYTLLNSVRNPRQFMEKSRNLVEQLSEKYPQVDQFLIKHAAIYHPRNALEFLDKVIKITERLQKEYPTLPYWVIQRAASYSQKAPKKFLDKILGRLPSMKQKFPELNDSIILQALTTSPTNPIAYLKRIRDEMPVLEKLYPDIPRSSLTEMLIRYEGDIKHRLDKARVELSRMTLLYPQFSRSNILELILRNPSKFEEKLAKAAELMPKLISQFPELYRSIIEDAALLRRNPEEYLRSFNEKVSALKILYPELETWVFIEATLRNQNPAEIVHNISRTLQSYLDRFPNVPRSEIIQILTGKVKKNDNHDIERILEERSKKRQAPRQHSTDSLDEIKDKLDSLSRN